MSDDKDSGVHVSDDGDQDTDAYTGDAEYQRKANLLNGAMQEIGMGRYQVR